nr:hypothetical protein CFP56_74957 [Quercus suber]
MILCKAYELEQSRGGGPGPSRHTRRFESVESAVPRPYVAGRRYPKDHFNLEGDYPRTIGGLHEAPLRYPQSAYTGNRRNQNAKGHYISPSGRRISPGFERVIYNDHGRVEGVSMHPVGNPAGFTRAHSLRSDGTVRHH